VELHPYRRGAERAPPVPPSPADLGAPKRTHTTSRRLLVQRLVVASVTCLVLAAFAASLGLAEADGGAPSAGAVAILTAIVVAIFALLAAPLVRMVGLRVRVHEDGIVVERGRARDAVAFEDVDAVYFELAMHSALGGEIALVSAVRLVERAGGVHRVPITVEDGIDVLRVILRRCTDPLAPDARAAIAAGEPLHFGDVTIDRDGISVAGARARWSELALVRMQPGRVALCRASKLWPWRTVRLDKVPHPTLFTALVTSLASKVEQDDPATKLLGG
jgi:hypothetical protein